MARSAPAPAGNRKAAAASAGRNGGESPWTPFWKFIRATLQDWLWTPSSTPRTGPSWAAAAWTARSTAPRDRGLLAECRSLGGCGTGDAKITAGYDLPARHIIHTVGPVWHGGGQDEAHSSPPATAQHRGGGTARCPVHRLPPISTGVYGYPPERAAVTAVAAVRKALGEVPDAPTRVIFTCFDEATYRLYQKELGG